MWCNFPRILKVDILDFLRLISEEISSENFCGFESRWCYKRFKKGQVAK